MCCTCDFGIAGFCECYEVKLFDLKPKVKDN